MFTFLCADISRCLFTEFIGTMFLVMIGSGLHIQHNSANLMQISLSYGATVAMFVRTTYYTSDGQVQGYYNPAVSVGLLVTGRITVLRCFLYIVCQCGGAVFGASGILLVTPVAELKSLGATLLGETRVVEGLVWEFLLTFILVLLIISYDHIEKCDVSAPAIIGLSVTIFHFLLIPYTGAGLNPARSFGPALIMAKWDNHLVYWLGPIVGGIGAGVCYRFHRKIFKMCRTKNQNVV